MKAHQLRTILEHVPDDLEIVIDGAAARECGHIHNVWRHGRSGDLPGALVLHGRFPVWAPCGVPDDFELHGPYRRRDELARRLDPEVPLGDRD